MTHETPYTSRIKAIAPTYNPWQIEAWLRLEFSTLDHLNQNRFMREVRMACLMVDEDPQGSISLAKSYGF